ncbi:MAG: C25 family cysteine peptidase, partial [Candidatus Thermoplasmatota archaeon]|nr:C25 family cysteine peptidase [Candidatus Thermoplasmatota archaeon]
IISSIGIFTFQEEETLVKAGEIDDVIEISGTIIDTPDSIIVSDTSPFYPLIATPVAVNYDQFGKRSVIPLYVMNFTEPSRAIERIRSSQLIKYSFNEYIIRDNSDPKNISLEIAERFWERANAALIINMDQSGYELGVLATPIASYLRIPVIVTDEIDADVIRVLRNIGVTYTIICDDSLTGYGREIHLKTVDEVMNATITITNENFGNIDYITLTNPIDAFPPEVLDSTEFYFGPESVGSASMNKQSLPRYLLALGNTVTWEFTIPSDYKYALIEFEGYNHDFDSVDEFGDYAEFAINPVREEETTLGGAATFNGIAKRDRAGNIIEDKLFLERVLYNCEGETYRITASGTWTFLDEGRVSSRVTIKKLDNPVYEMMGGLSSIAPYLTAYHKGIVFGKPDFAFTADDDIITNKGETSPGYYLPSRNIDLVPMSNRHIFDNIHEPLNKLLAKLADLPYGAAVDLKHLTDYYKNNPVHIALVGGITVLPRYTYDNNIIPIADTGFSTQRYLGGGGTHSDNIYANIDPLKYEYDNMAPDIHSSGDHPYLENIVGRIAGRNVQDGNALILRSMFYDDIIEGLSEWKENYGIMFGGGLDFRAPLWVQILNSLPPFKWMINLAYSMLGNLVNYANPPWLYDTGFSRIAAKAFEHKIGENLDFNVQTSLNEETMLDGLSYESLNKLKTASLWNRLTFSKSQIAALVGEGNVKGRDILENSNFIWLMGHGNIHNIGPESPDLVSSGTSFLGLGGRIWQKLYKNIFLPHTIPLYGPGGGFAKVGDYSPRRMATLDLGPSFIWTESCFVGRISGVTPQASVGMAMLHSGPAAMVASDSGANIPGGYLPGKNFLFDTWIGT